MPATVPLLAQIQEVHICGLCVTYVFGCIHVIPCILCVTRYDYTLMREVILQTNYFTKFNFSKNYIMSNIYFTKFNFTMCIVSKCRQSYNLLMVKMILGKNKFVHFSQINVQCRRLCHYLRRYKKYIFAGYV